MTRTLYVRLGTPALDRVLAAAVRVYSPADPALRNAHGHLARLTRPQSG